MINRAVVRIDSTKMNDDEVSESENDLLLPVSSFRQSPLNADLKFMN